MGKPGKFSNYLKRSYIHYALTLVSIIFVLFLAFMILNLRYTTVNNNQDCNTTVGTFMNQLYDYYNAEINELADSVHIKNAVLQKENTTNAYRQLYEFVSKQQIKPIFTLFDTEGNLIVTNLYQPNQLICRESSKMKEAVGWAANSPGRVYSAVSGIQYDNGQKTAYLFCKAVTEHGRIVGYLCFDLTVDGLDKLMRRNEVDIIALTDRFDNAFYYTSNSVLNSMGKCRLDWQANGNVRIDDKLYYGTSTLLPKSAIKVITLTSVWAQNQIFGFGLFFLCCLIALMVLLIFVFSRKVAQNNSRFIDSLLYAVKQCRDGNISYRINSITFDEFQILYDEFNQMMIQLQQLLQHNNELMERKRIMEVKQLEEQFNPHFVFNVMETLKYEIVIDPKQASVMVVSFANLMRYSINYGNAKVLLRTDIAYIKDYLMLQKMRYNQRLTYEIKMEDGLLDYEIPKLLIQPIVENCLSHGAENVDRINIVILGRKVNEVIELTIEDNGQGIEKDKLKEIQDMLQNENEMPEHIGLYNVHRAIKLLYGESYGLEISSRYGTGTKVTLKIPIKEGGSNV